MTFYKNTGLMLFAIGCLTAANGHAQTLTWGNKTPVVNETESKLSQVLDTKFYEINSRYNENLFNRDVNVGAYSLKDLNQEKTNVLSVEQPAMGKAMMTHLEMYPLKGADAVIFLDEFDTKTKIRNLFIQRVNLDTNVKTKPEVVTSMPTRNSQYFIAQSPNQSFYAVIKQHDYDKKLNEKINVTLLDKDFKVVREVTFETPYLNKTPLENQVYVSDQGTVFIVKNIDQAKLKPFKTVFFWDGNAQTMQETSLKFDNDFQIYQYQGHFDAGDFYLHGLYTRIGSKGVQMYGGGLPAAGVYAARFNNKGEKVYLMPSETGEIPGLNMKNFVIDGNKTWMLADKMFIQSKAKPMVQGQPYNWEKDYTYKNTAIAFGRIDNETGKLEWNKVLPFDEPDTTNDNGMYLSYLYFLNNNQLTILFNDMQKTKVGPRIMSDRFTAIETYDDRGNPVSKSLIGATGLELKWNGAHDYYEENFDLDTSVNATKVNDHKYIVRAKSNAGNEMFGYLNL
ncbi:MAG TPA: hypothetical protein VK623_04325 [Flavobacterium sp.]|nr:hypothetical protein [Flavobacterium sp.]